MTPWTIYEGDAATVLATLPEASVQCCVTSPPYWGQRNYGVEGELGHEATPAAYIAALGAVFTAVRRVLRDDGTLWLNMGDAFTSGNRQNYGPVAPGHKQATHAAITQVQRPVQPAGLPAKSLLGLPWRLAFALQDAGWVLRQDIIWHKPNSMPESVQDRPTTAHEHLFLFAKNPRYYYDPFAIAEPATWERWGDQSIVKAQQGKAGWIQPQQKSVLQERTTRNARSVWTIPTASYAGDHCAVFPTALVDPCIKAGTSAHGCCATCGAPWMRSREKTTTIAPSHKGSRFDQGKTGRNGAGRVQFGMRYTTVAGDFLPACGCAAPVVPCLVLDPFAGSGTTLLQATRLGRRSIGIELHPGSLAEARQRLRDDRPLLQQEGNTPQVPFQPSLQLMESV